MTRMWALVSTGLCSLCVQLWCDYRLLTQEHDEPVLSHLTDIKVIYQDDAGLVSGLGKGHGWRPILGW